jgi:hypothetical protein
VAELSVNNVLGQNIGATLIEARASAQCHAGQASVSAVSEVANLTINGEPIVVTGVDHGPRMKVKGTGVTAYRVVPGTTIRQIEGTFSADGQPPGTYHFEVDDQGEPGRDDVFILSLNGNPAAAEGLLEGGNIQLHTCK